MGTSSVKVKHRDCHVHSPPHSWEISCLPPAQKSSQLAFSFSNIYNKNGVMRLLRVESGLLPKPYTPRLLSLQDTDTRVPGTQITRALQAGQSPSADWGELPHLGRGATRNNAHS